MKKVYEPNKTEKNIYRLWEKSGFFNPDNLKGKEKFTILMPPPNANDPLHIGHALFVSLEDMMIRYQRLQGKKTLWLPGSDHAGFETQVVYEKKLQKQGRSRFDMNREEFYKEVWEYTKKNSQTVKKQLKSLGASCDWSRYTFSLDKKIVKTVYTTFKKMADDNLIYRGKRLINFCVKHQTAFSDLEVKKEERSGFLYYIKYGEITVATTRPETIFGDIALAVHPDDKRYSKFIGQEVPWIKNPVKVIADKLVDPEFGTGVVKITPAHDHNDYEIWTRHKNKLPEPIEVIDRRGRLTEITGRYHDMKIMEAREELIKELKESGHLIKEEPYQHQVSVCYKCNTPLEPLLLEQWFVHAKPLADRALKASKEIEFYPAYYRKTFNHWLKNIRDWNISRQNWWGISIPAWRCLDCGQWSVTDGKKPKRCPHCKHTEMMRDPDVFDTWFSSGQWPFATLQQDMKFYPTSVMETGPDIIFFWVARMIMLGLYRTNDIPFRQVYLHGLVCDKTGQKISKSKGNVIDPIEMSDRYGTDALRWALIMGSPLGRNTKMDENNIRAGRNFVNKIWNISRFIINYDPQEKKIRKKDERYIKDFAKTVLKTKENMDKMRFTQAGEIIYHYAWHTLADKIIEEFKNERSKQRHKILLTILKDLLIILHPFIPFVTEEIYQRLSNKKKEFLMIEKWPKL